MKEASAQSYLGKFMHHYDDDLKQTVEDYQGEFPSPPGPGWFVRTEHVSLKEGCYGMGPYISLTSVLQSAVTSAYRHRAVRRDDDACVLYFFPWVEIDPDREFRVFVHLDSVTALCPQRWFKRNEWLCSQTDEELENIVRQAVLFFDDHVKARLAYLNGSYTFDLAVLATGEMYFIEPNPSGAQYSAGSALFHWVRDESILVGEDDVTLRFISEIRGSS